jgi:hypothetical protein
MNEVTNIDLVILNNAAFKATVELSEGETPLDLSGYSLKMQCRPGVRSSTTYFELSSEADGGIVVTPFEGKFEMSMPASTTSTFEFLDGVYDVIATDSDGKTKRLIEGNVYIDFGATRIS